MGEARKVMDKLTEAQFGQDFETAKTFYANDAIGVTPDRGEIKGPDEIVGYIQGFFVAFPDGTYESIEKHESGNTAIDEGIFTGTNTEELELPNGDKIPATGKRVRLAGADIATVENGKIVSHRFYYDQLGMLQQLGMMPES